jgi:hypothetical protein
LSAVFAEAVAFDMMLEGVVVRMGVLINVMAKE